MYQLYLSMVYCSTIGQFIYLGLLMTRPPDEWDKVSGT